jgi:hypothetical protein
LMFRAINSRVSKPKRDFVSEYTAIRLVWPNTER